jgi:hypothetical protein
MRLMYAWIITKCAHYPGFSQSPRGGCSVYEFRYVRGHVEVFLDNVFQFSADTITEAQAELRGEGK